MKEKRTAFLVFYTDDGRILLQSRKGISKYGEEWAFFGGNLKKRESPKQAVKREIKEELNYGLKEFILVKEFSHIYSNILYKETLFVTKLPENYEKELTLLEGDNMGLFTIKEARNLKMLELDKPILDAVEKYLFKISKT